MENDNRKEEVAQDAAAGGPLVVEKITVGPAKPLEVRNEIVPTPNPSDQPAKGDHNTKNSAMLSAKDLSIIWGDNDSYWLWPLMNENSCSFVVAELIMVCWLHVEGKFNTVKLTPKIHYEVVFVVMLKDDADGWEHPINLKLSLPNGSIKEHQENMNNKPRGKWIEIPAGEFRTSPENTGEMSFSLYEHGDYWKRGLLVKGVLIKPKV